MLRNYLKIAYRGLMKNRLVSFINIFGLGLSMSVGMMEMIIVQSNLEYDRFHPYPERTYRVTSAYVQKNGNHWKLASTPLPLYGALATDTGIVESAVNIYPAIDGTASTDAKELPVKGAFTESSFFTVFGFSLAAGNAATALSQPNTMVVSKTMAARFFGAANPLGKVLNLQKRGQFIITGVLNDPPGKSHISFDLYASAASIPYLEKNKLLPAKSEDYGDYRTAYTYVLLKKGAGEKALAGKLNAVAADGNRTDKEGQSSFELQPIEKITPARDNLYNDIG
ncbi:MAG TPA: ABC transporter permease, partial [Chitinophagaceae bacterium]|nr:ABC transporter permease [Chitinophagaceae bacterium]